ncbi:MAG: CPBP family intramembrane metalloprotease [Acidobacteriales bacterium]|nr:CPBP family intramembrane metalloprotease [Candidatus Koribacter versatilis]MBI3645707.1 CPBP family intramembrane metalloprotease [Terriglobales bacterium]
MSSFFELSTAAQYFLFLVLVLVPLAGVVGYFRIRSGKPLRPKRKRYIATIAMLLTILVVTLAAAWNEGITLLGSQWGSPLIWLAVAGYMALLSFRLRAAWAKLSDERKEKARRLLPDEPSLMRLWVGVAALAGISEECAYRGLAYQLLREMGLNIALALLVCVVAFAIGHMTQGWRGVLGTFLLALFFHALVFATHSLYLAIAFHAAYNLIVGVIAMPILSEFAKRQALSQAEA